MEVNAHTFPCVNNNAHNYSAYVLHSIPSCETLAGLTTDLKCCHSVLMGVEARIELSGHKVQVGSGDMEDW